MFSSGSRHLHPFLQPYSPLIQLPWHFSNTASILMLLHQGLYPSFPGLKYQAPTPPLFPHNHQAHACPLPHLGLTSSVIFSMSPSLANLTSCPISRVIFPHHISQDQIHYILPQFEDIPVRTRNSAILFAYFFLSLAPGTVPSTLWMLKYFLNEW